MITYMRWIVLILMLAGVALSGAQPLLPALVRVEGEPAADPLAGRLYVAQRDVRLYRNRQLAGDLPARTVVEAQPLEGSTWIRLRYQDKWYDADGSAFLQESRLMQDLLAREARARSQVQLLGNEFERARQRMQALSEEAARWEAAPRPALLIFQAPPQATQRLVSPLGTDLRLLTQTPGFHQAALCRREMRKLNRAMEKMEQQLASYEQESLRLAEVRAAVERRFQDFRLAYSRP